MLYKAPMWSLQSFTFFVLALCPPLYVCWIVNQSGPSNHLHSFVTALPTSNMSSGWDFLTLQCLASCYVSTHLTVCDNWPCGACVSTVIALLPFLIMDFVLHFLCVGILPTYCCSVANQFSLCLMSLTFYALVSLLYLTGTNLGCVPTLILCILFRAQFFTYPGGPSAKTSEAGSQCLLW